MKQWTPLYGDQDVASANHAAEKMRNIYETGTTNARRGGRRSGLERGDEAGEAFHFEFADECRFNLLVELAQGFAVSQYLSALGLAAYARRQVSHGADPPQSGHHHHDSASAPVRKPFW